MNNRGAIASVAVAIAWLAWARRGKDRDDDSGDDDNVDDDVDDDDDDDDDDVCGDGGGDDDDSGGVREVRIVMAGFGDVGKAFARLLLDWEGRLRKEARLVVTVVAISTGRRGTVLAVGPGAVVDLAKALSAVDGGGMLDASVVTGGDGVCTPFAMSEPESERWIRAAAAEANRAAPRGGATTVQRALIEAIPVSYSDGEPASKLLRCALSCGLHALSANKGPLVHHRHELQRLASESNLSYLHESAVMDGVPVFNMARHCLPLVRIEAVRGCLNSTTTIILSGMESGLSFSEALKGAQDDGICETDPSGDVDGMDAAVKLTAILSTLGGSGSAVRILPFPSEVTATTESADSSPLEWARVAGACIGIRAVTESMVADAKASGKRWRLVASAEREAHISSMWYARVRPELLESSDPLYGLSGASSALMLHSDTLSPITVTSTNPTTRDTAYGLLVDMLHAVDKERK